MGDGRQSVSRDATAAHACVGQGATNLDALNAIPLEKRDEVLRFEDPDALVAKAAPRSPEYERYQRFGEEIDAVKKRVAAQIGDEDARYINNLGRVTRGLEIVGRLLIHFSPEPVTWTLGVLALGVQQHLGTVEIGHTVLHGAFDRVKGAEKYKARAYTMPSPLDEACWRTEHNTRHHAHTSIVGKDPDLGGESHRHSDYLPWIENHKLQHWFTALVIFPNAVPFLHFAVTGLLDNFFLRTQGSAERNAAAVEPFRASAKVALKKFGKYAFKNYVVFPALAGPMFWKVMLGNYAASTVRDIATAASFLPNHVGPDTPTYAPGTRPMNRGHWYAMQIEATNNFAVSRLVSIFAGGTDKHIEHHLFPTFPTERLRQVAPEVRAICEKYGVRYRELPWGTTLKRMFQQVKRFAKKPVEAGTAAASA